MAGAPNDGSNLPELNVLLRQLASLRHGSARFALSTVLAGVALIVALLCQLTLGSEAAAVFAFFVAVSTALFGAFAGLCTVAVAVLALDYFYLPPVFQLNLDLGTLRVALGLGGIAVITHLTERHIRQAIRRRRKAPIGLLGSFDGVEENEAYGWALDADHPQEPLLVTAFVNARPVTQIAAVHYRPDVAAKRRAGSHGFYVDLSSHLPPQGEAMVDVRFPNGWSLPGSPKIVRAASVAARPERPTILFMHIPKTAGTAFREAIAANYRQSEIAYLYPTPPGFLVGDLKGLPLEQLRQLDMIIGHFQFGMHEWLPRPSEYITMVREPVARVLSQYRYLCQTQGPEPVPPLAHLLERELTVNFDNAMVRCFAGVDERACGPGSLTKEHYARAVSNMQTAFAYIGHQESLETAYHWLARRYRWHPCTSLAVVNVTNNAFNGDSHLSSSELVRRYNRWDCMLYDEICRKFPLSRTVV